MMDELDELTCYGYEFLLLNWSSLKEGAKRTGHNMKDTNGTSWKARRSHHELRNIWSFLCTGEESGKLMPIAHLHIE